MKTFLIIYAIGVVLNALMAASVWDDMKEDRQLEKVRLVSIVMFIALSFITWCYAVCYLFYKNMTKPKKKNNG